MDRRDLKYEWLEPATKDLSQEHNLSGAGIKKWHTGDRAIGEANK